MQIDSFSAFMTEGLEDASVRLAPNGEDFEMRVRAIPDMIGLALKCARLGIKEVLLESDDDPVPSEIVITFSDAVDLEFQQVGNLTAREQQVMEMLAHGRTNREIAEDLEVSIKTVDTHRGHVLKKLRLRNNAELTRFAVRNGLVPA